MAFLKFRLPTEVNLDAVRMVELAAWGQSKVVGGGAGVETIAHVYGIVDDSWTETGIKWSNASNVWHAYHDVNDIRDNHVLGLNQSATFLGHMTARSTPGWMGVDVTDFVKAHPDEYLSFIITRELRYEARPELDMPTADPISDDRYRSMWIASSENTSSPHPALVVFQDL